MDHTCCVFQLPSLTQLESFALQQTNKLDQRDGLTTIKPLYRYGATASNPAGHFSLGMTYLDNYNAADAEPYGYLPSNDYRFLCQIPQLEFTNNDAIDASKDQNPFRGQ